MKYFTLVLLVFLLAFSIASLTSCGGADTTVPSGTQAPPTDSTGMDDENPTDDPSTSKAPPMLTNDEKTVPENGFIQVNSASYISGTLLQIDNTHPYQYNVSTLKPSHKIGDSVSYINGQNLIGLYGKTNQKYLLKSSKLFYKDDAFSYLDGMLSQFAEDSGKNNIQIVNAYLYSDPSTLTNEYVAGYSIAINIFENDVTYSITASEFDFQYHGKTVSCLDWFIENCMFFGYIYTGLTGSQQQTLATFRFVGVPHAIAMTQYDMIDVSEYNRTIRLAEKLVIINDSYTDTIWYVTYAKAHESNTNTIIELPAHAKYIISGDNEGGFIIAYKLS